MKYHLRLQRGSFPETTVYQMKTQVWRGKLAVVSLMLDADSIIPLEYIVQKLRRQLAMYLWKNRKRAK